MSQFFGFLAFKEDANIKGLAEKMLKTMSFFQTNQTGCYFGENIFICNKLLFNSIESENTPEICQTDRYILAASCRIDNRAELHDLLQLTGDIFGNNAISDHEYILKAYEKFGQDCVLHLIGDFSFVIWDKSNKSLFMAKDHLGIRPLFYLINESFLVFSTSIIAIKSVFKIPLILNELYIAYILKNYPPPVEMTFFEDIQRLKPAHFCFFDKGKLGSEKAYWELTKKDISYLCNEEDYINEIRQQIELAIECRIRTTKNIGCQLSGGLDSSAITIWVSKLVDKYRLHTYSFVLNEKTRAYSEKGIDEQQTQKVILDYGKLNIENHHPIEDFHFKDVFEEMEHSNLIMGGYAHSDSIWQASLFNEAQKNKVGVCFSGFPGDECVSNSGIFFHYDYIFFKDWRNLWKFFKEYKLRALKRLIEYYFAKSRGNNSKKYLAAQKQRNLLDRNSKFYKLVNEDTFAKFYPSFKETLKQGVCRAHICLRCESEGAYALAHNIETVYPFADIRLLQTMYSLPTELFKPEPLPRMLFRKVCLNILPENLRLQSKNNGSLALAFFEYIKHKQLEESKEYVLGPVLDYCEIKKSPKFSKIENSLNQFKLLKLDFLMTK